MIPPAKMPSKILNTKDKICQAFEFGKLTFSVWVENGLPVKKISGRWCGHYDDIEEFIRTFLQKK